jgi:hypothetical protein
MQMAKTTKQPNIPIFINMSIASRCSVPSGFISIVVNAEVSDGSQPPARFDLSCYSKGWLPFAPVLFGDGYSS